MGRARGAASGHCRGSVINAFGSGVCLACGTHSPVSHESFEAVLGGELCDPDQVDVDRLRAAVRVEMKPASRSVYTWLGCRLGSWSMG